MQSVLSSASLGHPALHKLDRYRKGHLQQAQNRAQREYQQKLADSSSNDPQLQVNWFQSMKYAFEEMDDVFKLVNAPDGFHFLDVGCCPGGFSSYILERNLKTLGTGLSLEVSKGGHDFLLEEQYRHRYELVWGDITSYQLGNVPLPGRTPFPPIHPSTFALVLLDGHPLRTSVSDGSTTKNPQTDQPVHIIGDCLLISQLIIGLTTVAQGGTVIIKLSRPERLISAQLMWLFDSLAADIRTWKPVCIHATRGTFYLIARGMGFGVNAVMYDGVLQGLKALWEELILSQRRLRDNDLDFIIEKAVLQGPYSGRLTALSAHIWEVQEAAWKGWRQQVKNGF
ncbi:hypothetical protein BDY19DRAFT_239556 [Irpex rosettiformis]|uniref:Uncharacterized protein n=1 Tax=Irpex rosettiformis TaxID=378272 RepID=A0ACB8TZV5_9APHY|nr:hypothetical protein BDY19DRAFT_239556 [Irpex rosettiformis]